MEEDPIMQELREVRRQLLEEAGGDLGKLLERADREAPKILAHFRKTQEKPRPESRRRPATRKPRASSFRSTGKQLKHPRKSGP